MNDPSPRFPISGWYGPHPIFDLGKIPREEWRHALELMHPPARLLSLRGADQILREARDGPPR